MDKTDNSVGSSAKKSKLDDTQDTSEEFMDHASRPPDSNEESTDLDMLDPVTDLKLLRSENTYLKRQNLLLQKLLAEHKVFTSQKSDILTGSNNHFLNNQLYFCILPDVAIIEILNKIPDQHSLLNCRLVSKNWNTIIEDSAVLMRNIIVPIWHVKPFLELPIVKKRKVKSIQFKNSSPLEFNYNRKFTNVIKNSDIQKVEFSFESANFPDAHQQQELLRLVLEKCSSLQELILGALRHYSLTSQPLKFFRNGLWPTTQIRAVDKICMISVNVAQFIEADANGLISFLLMLPKLKEIKFFSRCESEAYKIILQGLCRYLFSSFDRGEPLQLKELTLGDYQMISTDEEHKLCIDLMVSCGRRKVVLNGLPELNFNCSSAILASARTDKISIAKVSGDLTLEGSKLTEINALDCLNIEELTVHFKRDAFNGEISWIKNLSTLESLVLVNRQQPQLPLSERPKLGQPTIAEFEEAFSAGLTSLQTLEIQNELFDSINVFRWSQYFPNLWKLDIDECNSTADNLILELTALESLERLYLTGMPNLLDATFTAECVNRYSEANGTRTGSLMPAIACFKSLTYLGITSCNNLTNACIINGISKSKTLKTFDVFNCKNITEECCIKLCKFDVCYENV